MRASDPPPLASAWELACEIAFNIPQNSYINFPMPSSLQSSAVFCTTQRVFKPSQQPRSFRPAASKLPCGRLFGRPSGELLRFLADFCTPQNSLKKRIPKKMPQHMKSRTPDRPNVDFGITFGVHLGIDFHPPHPCLGCMACEITIEISLKSH